MTLYRCLICKQEKEVARAKIIYKDNKWVADVKCECGLYMDSKPTEGMPQIKRTEKSLSRKKRGDLLWESAKEKLCGERGINEDFN